MMPRVVLYPSYSHKLSWSVTVEKSQVRQRMCVNTQIPLSTVYILVVVRIHFSSYLTQIQLLTNFF